jgi:hypothetical protein
VFAHVIVDRPTHRRPPAGSDPLRDDVSRLATYTYRLPERLRDLAAVGHLVQVPFGAGNALGVIRALGTPCLAICPRKQCDGPKSSIRCRC